MSDQPPTTTISDLATLPVLVPSRLPAPMPDRFTAEQRRVIEQIVSATKLSDTTSIMTFGAAPQQRLSRHLTELIGDSTIGQAGVGGEITMEVSRGIERMNLRQMRLELDGRDWAARVFGGWPIIGRYVSALRAFYLDRQRIRDEFDRIEARGEQEKASLIESLARFDALVKQLEVMLTDIAVHMVAGQQVMGVARQVFEAERTTLNADPAEQRDPVQVARLRDAGERIAQFDVRLVNLHLAYTEAMQAVPEVRNAGKATEIELQNVMESMLKDVVRLKRAVVQMVSLNDMRRAREGTEKRRALSNEIAELAARGTKEAYLEAKAGQGDFDDELAQLERTAAHLQETLREGARLERENGAKREAARRKLQEMRTAFARDMEQAQNAV